MTGLVVSNLGDGPITIEAHATAHGAQATLSCEHLTVTWPLRPQEMSTFARRLARLSESVTGLEMDATREGVSDDGPDPRGDATTSGDGADSHDVGETDPKPTPAAAHVAADLPRLLGVKRS